MTLPLTSPASDKIVTIPVYTIDTTYYAPVPVTGRIKEFMGVLGAALTGADETYTLSYAPPGSVTYTAVTGGALLFANSGSAAGNVAANKIGIGSTTQVVVGGSLKIVPTGGGGGAVPIILTIRIGN